MAPAVQLDIDFSAPPPGSLQFDSEFRAALGKAIADSGKRREDIAAEMESLLGHDPEYPISRALLDAWTAPSRTGHRFPALYLPAFIVVTGAYELLDMLARKIGRRAVTNQELAKAELGRVVAERIRLQSIENDLRRRVRSRS